MKLTDRDVEIIRFINEFGFCEITQLTRKFDLKKPRCYQIMERLVKANFVKHERIFYGKHGVFYLTNQGASFSNLPPIKNIPKDNYDHQLAIINVYFKMMQEFPNAEWLSERFVRKQKSLYSVGKKIKHLCDGVLVLSDDKQIAIEVELTMKSKERLNEIIRSYALHKHIKEVWYYCSPETLGRVQRAADKWEHVKVYGLE